MLREDLVEKAVHLTKSPFLGQIYRRIRLSRSDVFYQKFGFSCTRPSRTHTLGVIWDTSILSFLHNEDLVLLQFPLSAFQEWIVAVTQVSYSCVDAQSLRDKYALLKSAQTQLSGALIFPFCLFNHLLCMLRHKKATNVMVPIHVHEYASGKLLFTLGL